MFDMTQFAAAPSGGKLEIVEEMASCLSKQEIEAAWKILRTHHKTRVQVSDEEKRKQWKIGDNAEFHSTKAGGMIKIRIMRVNYVSVSGVTEKGNRWTVAFDHLRKVVS